ncbi:bifunctional ThiF-MoeB-HesA family/Ubiquitin-activating enzyme E1 [Babesia duncani]|uniref:Bifunctional ThiF-MoeB-HesA family/Ubiquitin-activating enzyme E1 n=1 Tax=Babesia duncani TaxID=323732 RepID=A0AAD9PKM3_9APIC|nr:bifunctional ThiF-MoeB-HesA family/Ubiquitin-activating enzyme E1 [Babesia duncani]
MDPIFLFKRKCFITVCWILYTINHSCLCRLDRLNNHSRLNLRQLYNTPAALKPCDAFDFRKKRLNVKPNQSQENNSFKDSRDSYNAKWSRLELVFGSDGLEKLNKATVLVVGANKLSLELITHLISAGIGKIQIWDGHHFNCHSILSRIGINCPEANISIINNEPDWKNINADLVIFSNQSLSDAAAINKKLRRRCKFIACTVVGPYGLTVSDFGNEHLHITPTDTEFDEHVATVIQNGQSTVLKLDTNDVGDYKVGDIVKVTASNHHLNTRYNQCAVKRYKCKITSIHILNGEHAQIVIDLDTSGWKDNVTISIQRLHLPHVYKFKEIQMVLNELLQRRSFFDAFSFFKSPEEIKNLYISPFVANSDMEIGTIVACFLALDQLNMALSSGVDEVVDASNAQMLDICRRHFRNCNAAMVREFNLLRRYNIPPSISLVAALTAQEALKAIVGKFTPSQAIVINRSDAFRFDNRIEKERVESAIKRASEMQYVMVGAGALGCEYLKLLQSMNVEHLQLFDPDIVQESNLPRQLLFSPNDINKPKAYCAIENLRKSRNAALPNYKAYCVDFNQATSRRFAEQYNVDFKNTVLISAVDNIQTRLLLDNFSIEHGLIFVEAGLHSNTCSTSISVPNVTESFASTLGDDFKIQDGAGCSSKGIPRTFADVIYYSVELYSWLFTVQPKLYNQYIADPNGTIENLLLHGPEQFSKALVAIMESASLVVSPNQNLNKWAQEQFKKYVNVDHNLQQIWLESIMELRKKNLMCSRIKPNSKLDKRFILSLINKHVQTPAEKAKCIQLLESFCNNEYIKKLSNSLQVPQMHPFTLNDNCMASIDFVYANSNLRAFKYGFYQKDRLSIIKIAKAIVPAISTIVSVASSMSIFELYKALVNNASPVQTASRFKRYPTPKMGDVYFEWLTSKDGRLWFSTRGQKLYCFRGAKALLSIDIYPYKDQSQNTVYVNNYLNLATQRYISNVVLSPSIFTVEDPKALLYGLRLSLWDYITIDDSDSNDLWHTNVKKTSMLLGYIIEAIESLFNVDIEGLEIDSNIIILTDALKQKPISTLFNSNEINSTVIHLLAKDRNSGEAIELPDIKYSRQHL